MPASSPSGRRLSSPLLGPQVRFDLVGVLVALVLVVTAQAFFMRFKNIYTNALLTDVVYRLRTDLFQSVAQARWRYIASLRGSDLQHTVTAEVDRMTSAAFQMLVIIQDLVLLAAYLGVPGLSRLRCRCSPSSPGRACCSRCIRCAGGRPRMARR